jgi:hypothetical protein
MIYFGYGDRVIAADEIERLREAVRAERAAILELIESARTDGHLYDGDYCLQTVAAAIRARGEAAMSEKEGILSMMASGRVHRPGRLPVEITSGELFPVEFAGVKGLQLMRITPTANITLSTDPLRDGLRATGEQG